jgi:hypothetical protein
MRMRTQRILRALAGVARARKAGASVEAAESFPHVKRGVARSGPHCESQAFASRACPDRRALHQRASCREQPSFHPRTVWDRFPDIAMVHLQTLRQCRSSVNRPRCSHSRPLCQARACVHTVALLAAHLDTRVRATRGPDTNPRTNSEELEDTKLARPNSSPRKCFRHTAAQFPPKADGS